MANGTMTLEEDTAIARELACPCCATPMVAGDFGGVELDTCGGCRGLWLDGGEWSRVFGRELEVEPAQAPRSIDCPACAANGRSVTLDVVRVAGSSVEIDRCESCGGSFLDSGEMQALRRAGRPGPRPPTLPSKAPGKPTASGAAPFLGGLAGLVAAGIGKLTGEGEQPPRPATPTRPAPPPRPVPGASHAQPHAAEDAPTRESEAAGITLRFNCAHCGGPVDAEPEDLVLDCRFCGSWSRLLRAEVADACAVECPNLEESDLATSWIERQVAILKARLISEAENRRDEHGALAREMARQMAEAAAARERERLRTRVRIGQRRLLHVPYLHEFADGYQIVLGRERGGNKCIAVVGFLAEATEPAYDRRQHDFRDRGLRLHRGRLRLLTAKDMTSGFEGLPVADPQGVATFSVNRERIKPKPHGLSELARIGQLHGRRTEIVYKPYWVAEIQDERRTEWILVDGQTGVVAGSVTSADELHRLLQPPGDSPFLPDWEAKAILVPHRCPECGTDLETDRKAWFRPCTNCHVGIARTENGLERHRYSHVETAGSRSDWFPAWRFRFRSPRGHEDLRAVRGALRALNPNAEPQQLHVWVPARRLLGSLPGDRAFARFAEHLHHVTLDVVDEPLPPITQGLVLGAQLDAKQAEALAHAAVAASLSGGELARANAANMRQEVFCAGWSFTEPRLVYLPGIVLPTGAFQLTGTSWPIPERTGGY